MNLILLFPEDFHDPDRVILTDYRAIHIREILKGAVGRSLRVGRVNGGVGEGKIIRIDPTSVELVVTIAERLPEVPILSLILALPRPQTLKKVLEVVGAFGIKGLFLIQTDRVQKGFFNSKLLKEKGWLKYLRLGLEQGGRTYLPQVSVHLSLRSFLSDQFGNQQEREGEVLDSIRLIADPSTDKTLWDLPIAVSYKSQPIFCAIGPEGGWSLEEVRRFVDVGFQPVRLGSTIHRVENAVTSLLAQIGLFQLKWKDS